MTTTTLPAVVRRMRPTDAQVDHMTGLLADARLSVYWPLLAETLMRAVDWIHDEHARQCRRRDCRTCAAIGEAGAWVDAHDGLQDNNGEGEPTIPLPTRQFRRW